MHRRGAGIGAIKNKNLAQARFKDKGNELASDQLAQLSKQLESFKTNLEDFASKHRNDIRKSPEFRRQFQEMCATIGVDPLASGKGFWAEMLGVGNFYYELGVQIIEICLATAPKNGGLLSMDELYTKLIRSRGRQAQEISKSDILMAIKKLKALGSGFTVLPMGDQYLIQSVPGELTMDHTTLLEHAQTKGFITREDVAEKLSWADERFERGISFMLKEGLAWVDQQASPHQYWFPSLFSEVSMGT